MTHLQEKLQTYWQDIANLLIGVWLVISPFALAYSAETTAAWNAQIVGAAIIVMAVVALWAIRKWDKWTGAALSAWLIVSPWILGYGGLAAATWNQVLVGLALGILALWSTTTDRDSGGALSQFANANHTAATNVAAQSCHSADIKQSAVYRGI